MARSGKFYGHNREYQPRDEPGETVARHKMIYAYNNGAVTYSVWRPSREEMIQIAQTGEIWLGVMNGVAPMAQTFLGSRSEVLRDTLDMGKPPMRAPGNQLDETL